MKQNKLGILHPWACNSGVDRAVFQFLFIRSQICLCRNMPYDIEALWHLSVQGFDCNLCSRHYGDDRQESAHHPPLLPTRHHGSKLKIEERIECLGKHGSDGDEKKRSQGDSSLPCQTCDPIANLNGLKGDRCTQRKDR